jgi:hypothetical protein
MDARSATALRATSSAWLESTPGVITELQAENQRLSDTNAALRDAHAALRDAHAAELQRVRNSSGERLRELHERVFGAQRLLERIFYDALNQMDMQSTLESRIQSVMNALAEPRYYSRHGDPDATPQRDDESEVEA